MVSLRPFTFPGLRRYTREQIAVQESLALHLTRRPLRQEFLTSVSQLVERYLKVTCQLSQPEWKPVARAEVPAILPAVGCLLILGAAPSEHKLIVDLDPGIAALVVDRLLGGGGEEARLQRPFTEIEEGVLSFLVLQVLTQVHSGWETGRELALTLDRFATRFGDIQAFVDPVPSFYLVGLRVAVGRHVGYVRIFVPWGLITKSFSATPAQSGGTAEEQQLMRTLLDSIGPLATEGRIEVAQLDLGPPDIANLEVGDIIILENHRLEKSASGFSGEVFVKLGAGMNGGIKGRWFNDEGQSRLEVLEILVQEQPLEVVMPQQDGAPAEPAPDGDNFAEAQGLLRDVEAPVIVELGRIKLNTAQVIRLRAGQILRLPRGPNDPVDLVVNGKLFARGELIEVDGELGVRLVQVVGQR